MYSVLDLTQNQAAMRTEYLSRVTGFVFHHLFGMSRMLFSPQVLAADSNE